MPDFEYDRIAVNGEDFDSTAIETLAYNRETEELFVEFASGGEYVYADVAESTYNLFVDADSVGVFYRNYIAGKYTNDGDQSYYLTERGEVEDVAVPTPVYREGDRVEIFGYGDKSWDGLATITEDFPAYLNDNIILVEADNNDFGVGGFDPKYIRPLTMPEPDDAYSRYSVKWESESALVGGNPEFQAVDEADALRQFNAEVERVSKFLGKHTPHKIVSVTHYF